MSHVGDIIRDFMRGQRPKIQRRLLITVFDNGQTVNQVDREVKLTQQAQFV